MINNDVIEVTINGNTFDMTNEKIKNEVQELLKEINIDDTYCEYTETVIFIQGGTNDE